MTGGASVRKTELDNVIDMITSSDALMIFLDSEEIIRNATAVDEMVGNISMLIQQTAGNIEDGYPFPISIILTKGDKIHPKTLLSSAGYKSLSKTIDLLKLNDNLRGLVTITSVGRIMKNIEYPFLLSMHSGLTNGLSHARANQKDNEDKAQQYRQMATWGNWISDRFNGRPTWIDMSKESRKKAAVLASKAIMLEKHLQKIDKIIKNEANRFVWPLLGRPRSLWLY